MSETICSVETCERRVHCRGVCHGHYKRLLRGRPLRSALGEPLLTVEERFWQKVDVKGADECWEWLGYRTADGYGQFWIADGNVRIAHRFVMDTKAGRRLTPDEHCDHLCQNRACVNPAHLEVVSHAENQHRRKLTRRSLSV